MCHDARELFSAEIDGVLDADEAASLQAHLAECPECRRELARFRATVAVLHSVEPLRAPAGFVDRVLDAARPPSWTERLRRWLASPLALRGPIAVTVTALVAVTAVYLYERTPELQRGFEVAVPARPVEPLARPAPPPAAPAPQAIPAPRREAPAREPATDRFRAMTRSEPAPPPASPEPARDIPATTGEKKAAASEEKNVAAGSAADESRKEQMEARLDQEKRQLGAAQAPPREGERAERAASSPPVASPPAAARAKAAPDLAKSAVTAASPPDVEGRLGVADRSAARQAVVELATRLGGAAAPALADARGDVVDLVVPAAAYPELVAGLNRLGRWAPVREPAALSGQVRVSLLLTD
jgi:hypothetical protein